MSRRRRNKRSSGKRKANNRRKTKQPQKTQNPRKAPAQSVEPAAERPQSLPREAAGTDATRSRQEGTESREVNSRSSQERRRVRTRAAVWFGVFGTCFGIFGTCITIIAFIQGSSDMEELRKRNKELKGDLARLYQQNEDGKAARAELQRQNTQLQAALTDLQRRDDERQRAEAEIRDCVLQILEHIFEKDDPSLAFRFGCCGSGPARCGACALEVNDTPALACQKQAEKEMVLKPHRRFRVIKDLVVDFETERDEK